jgi:hypothetical protein
MHFGCMQPSTKHGLPRPSMWPKGRVQRRPGAPATRRRSAHPTKRNAPHCTPKTAVSTPLHLPLSTRLDEISLRPAAQSEPFFGPFGPPSRPRGPLPPINCAKFAGAGSSPPLRPPLRRCAARGWATPSRKAPPSAEDRGQPQSKTHRTKKPGGEVPFRNPVRLGVG